MKLLRNNFFLPREQKNPSFMEWKAFQSSFKAFPLCFIVIVPRVFNYWMKMNVLYVYTRFHESTSMWNSFLKVLCSLFKFYSITNALSESLFCITYALTNCKNSLEMWKALCTCRFSFQMLSRHKSAHKVLLILAMNGEKSSKYMQLKKKQLT